MSYDTFTIAENIEALKAVWFPGDDFMKDLMNTFRAVKTQVKTSNTDLPYLHDNYNIVWLDTPKWSNIRSFLATVFNRLVKELNTKPYYLPHYLVIVLNKDLIQSAELFNYGVSRTIEDTLKWFLVNVNSVIETRKEDLSKKRAGAVSTTTEPRLVLVNMIKCPENSMNKKVYSLATKFNRILQEVIAGNKCSHYLPIEIKQNNTNFDHIGNITQRGLMT